MAKKSFGKNLLRVGSMLLALLMLVSVVFTGVATSVNAATTDEYVVKVAMNRNSTFGQNVELEEGKTYVLSLYTSGDVSLMARYNGYTSVSNDESGLANDMVYRRKYIKFTVPSAAPDTENGNKSIWVGIANAKLGYFVYYYGFKLYDVENPDVNLLNDADLSSGGYNLNTWCTSTGATLPSGLYTRATLASIGDMEKFMLADTERYLIKLAENQSSSNAFIGQHVLLEEGKTYIVSNCYTDDNISHVIRRTGTYTGIATDAVNYDNDYFKKSTTFTVPEYDDVDGTVSMWVGIQCWNRTSSVYYYDFKLYDIENPEVNLFEDTALFKSGSSLDSVWSHPSKALVKGCYSKVSLADMGGMETFEKTDADRYVVKLAAGSKESTAQFGQRVSLKGGKTYTFSYYYAGPDANYSIYLDDDNWGQGNADSITYDDDMYKKYITFTVPEEHTTISWIGIQGRNSSKATYFYDFKLYDVENPTVNLLNDYALNSTSGIDGDVWKRTANRTLTSGYYSKTTLAEAGGMDIFKIPANVIGVYDRKNVSIGQNVELEVGKTYSYSYYYYGPTLIKGMISNGDALGQIGYAPTKTIYDEEYNKVTYEFVAPAEATPSTEEGKVVVYLGMQVLTADSYYIYSPCVYATDDETKTNLFKDSDFKSANTLTNADGAPNWYRHYDYAAVGKNFSCSSLNSDYVGGIDKFKKTDANRWVLKLDANTTGQPYIGQLVTLETGKTYIFSNYYVSGITANQEVYEVLEDGSKNRIDVEVINDTEMSKSSVKFTLPEDESGSKLVYVGFRGFNKEYNLYYYDLKLYEENAPEVNLLKDYSLLENALNVNTTIWRTLSDVAANSYSKVTLDSIGGINVFLPLDVKCDVTEDGKVDVRDLVRMKKFSVGSIDSLPEFRGDLDISGTIADAADLTLLRKEILK